MTLPKRIRLLKSCRDHLYSRVKVTLATDKQIRDLREFDRRVEEYYVKQTTVKQPQ